VRFVFKVVCICQSSGASDIILLHTYLITLSNAQRDLKIYLTLLLEILKIKLVEDVYN